MANRRRIVLAVVAVAAVGLVAGAAALAAVAPDRSPAPRASSPAAAGPRPTGTPGGATPGPSTPLSAGDAAVLDYVAGLPTVHDVTPETVGEFTDLVCSTLRSPKMSPAFYAQVVAVERSSYSLSDAQAGGLLRAAAQSGCPDAVRVVDSGGSQASGVPTQ
ncbi:hypothetical protein [Leifsonia shinshuensis]